MTGRPLPLVMVTISVLLFAASDAAAQAPSCTISVTSVVFGSYNVFTTTAGDSTATITYRCNSKATNISIGLTTGSSGAFLPRTMLKGGEPLDYNLYLNAGRTNIWGDGTGGTSTYTRVNPPNNSDVNLTVYGRIPAGQDVSAGSYADTVTAIVNF